MKFEIINTEWEVFVREGTVGVGGIRRVNRDSLLVHLENYGETEIARDQIKAAHDGKVILDMERLPIELRTAISHAHDIETGRRKG